MQKVLSRMPGLSTVTKILLIYDRMTQARDSQLLLHRFLFFVLSGEAVILNTWFKYRQEGHNWNFADKIVVLA